MKWRRLYGPPEAYARRALVNRATNRWRARRRRPERPLDGVDPGTPDAADEVVVRDVVVAALRTLPARQRAAVVLRFLEDLPVVEVARALDCSEGTVKSHTSRGLTRLRRALADSGLAGRAVGATVLVGAPVAGRGARPGPAVHAGAPVVSLVGAAVQVAGAAGVGRAYAVGGLTECGL
jgi:hypothetical protein